MVKTGSTKILALDTATECGSMALLEGNEVVAEFRLRSAVTHSARLLSSMEFLLRGAGWKLRDLNLIAAGVGPGSFTGIRIGLSTALGIAQTLGISFAGVSGLDALVRQASFRNAHVGVAMDAKRSQIYYAEYKTERNKMRMVMRPRLWCPVELASSMTRRPLYIIGDAAPSYLEALHATGNKRVPDYVATDLYIAGSIGRLGLLRKRYWRSGRELKCDPLYIRPPDARKPKGRRS